MYVFKGGFFIKTVILFTAVLLSFFISGFECIDVGGNTVGVVCFDIPVGLQDAARALVIRGAVNAVTFGSNLEYADDHVTVVAGYSPLFKRIGGLNTNIQAAARSTAGRTQITIGVPALPPESY